MIAWVTKLVRENTAYRDYSGDDGLNDASDRTDDGVDSTANSREYGSLVYCMYQRRVSGCNYEKTLKKAAKVSSSLTMIVELRLRGSG